MTLKQFFDFAGNYYLKRIQTGNELKYSYNVSLARLEMFGLLKKKIMKSPLHKVQTEMIITYVELCAFLSLQSATDYSDLLKTLQTVKMCYDNRMTQYIDNQILVTISIISCTIIMRTTVEPTKTCRFRSRKVSDCPKYIFISRKLIMQRLQLKFLVELQNLHFIQ